YALPASGGVQLIGVVRGVVDVLGVLLQRLDDVGDLGTLVAQDDPETLVEEGHLAEPGRDRLEVVFGGLEGVLAGEPRHAGAGLLAVLQVADLAQVVVRGAVGELLLPQLAAVLHLEVELAGQRVHDRDADAVQTAGNLVATAAELASGVQHGERQRRGRQLLPGGGAGRDASTVVVDPDAAVSLERHGDRVAVAGEGLVDGVVDDLPDQVVQAPDTGGTDVHTWP